MTIQFQPPLPRPGYWPPSGASNEQPRNSRPEKISSSDFDGIISAPSQQWIDEQNAKNGYETPSSRAPKINDSDFDGIISRPSQQWIDDQNAKNGYKPSPPSERTTSYNPSDSF